MCARLHCCLVSMPHGGRAFAAEPAGDPSTVSAAAGPSPPVHEGVLEASGWVARQRARSTRSSSSALKRRGTGAATKPGRGSTRAQHGLHYCTVEAMLGRAPALAADWARILPRVAACAFFRHDKVTGGASGSLTVDASVTRALWRAGAVSSWGVPCLGTGRSPYSPFGGCFLPKTMSPKLNKPFWRVWRAVEAGAASQPRSPLSECRASRSTLPEVYHLPFALA